MYKFIFSKKWLSAVLCLVLVLTFIVSFIPVSVLASASISALPFPTYSPLKSTDKEKYVADEIIVKFKDKASKADETNLNAELGAEEVYTSPHAGFKVLKISKNKTVEDMVEAYNKRDIVEYAEPNYIDSISWTPNDPFYSLQWHFGQINMPAAWDLDTSAPNYGGDYTVLVAIIDSGVAYETYSPYTQAPDLNNTMFVSGWDFVNSDAHANDDNGHGTHVCGTIAQSTSNALGVAGIAFNVAIMPVKTLNSSGSGTHAAFSDGVHWAVDHGARIINYSAGGSHSTTKEAAVAYAYSHGVTVICAAGNDYQVGNAPSYPAAYDAYCIAVGAVRYDQTHSYYSNTGSYLDIVAPGGDVTVDQNSDGYPDGVLQQTFEVESVPNIFSYVFYQGTSMACPHVTGVAALILSRNPNLTPDQLRQALQSTATDLGTAGWDATYGWGLLNAPAAISSVGTAHERLMGVYDIIATGQIGQNYLAMCSVNANKCGLIREIKVKCTIAGSVKVALYSDSAGAPGSLLVANNIGAVVTPGWNTITLPTPTLVELNAQYWIATISSTTCVGYAQVGGNYIYYRALNYASSFPASASDGYDFSISDNYVCLTSGWGTLETPTAPTVTNSTGASSITDVAARLNGNLTSTGSASTTVYVYWGDNDGATMPGNWDHVVNLGVLPAGAFYTDISGLTGTTNYYYRCYAINSFGSDWADATTGFTTTAPMVKLFGMDDATDYGPVSPNYLMMDRFTAAASGNVNQIRVKCKATGSVKVALYSDVAGSPGSLIAANNIGSSVVVGWNIIDLPSTAVTAGTNYWIAFISSVSCVGYTPFTGGAILYRSLAYSNSFPASAGPIGEFGVSENNHGMTAAWGVIIISAPTVTNSTGASNVAETTARLNGDLVTTGGSATTVHICWGETDGGTTPGSWDNDISLGVLPVGTFYLDVPGLTLSTTYYYRCYAVNSSGTDWADATSSFTTTVPPAKLMGMDDAAPTNPVGGGYLVMDKYTAVTSGNVNQIRVMCTTSGNLKVALYADNAGSPGSLIIAVNTGVSVVAGWNTINLPSPIPVAAGTNYWIAFISSTSCVGYIASPGGAILFRTLPYPNSFPASAGPVGEFTTVINLHSLTAAWGTIIVTAPDVTNSTGASGVTETAARLNGNLTSTGGAATTVHICWGETDGGTTPGNWDNDVDLGALSVGAFFTDISGLTGSTTYYYRCYAVNSAGTDWADATSSFMTNSPPVPPTVTNSTDASSITDITARLNGELTSTGNASTTVYVYWGETDGGTTPGSWDHEVNLGVLTAGAFYVDISGLTASTPYYYRCYAVNSAGSHWADATSIFTTTAPPVKLMGMDDAVPLTNPVGGGYLVMDKFTAVGTGNISQIRIKCTTAGSVKVALYSDSAGSPGTLLVANNIGTSVVTGWNTIILSTPTPITAGTSYWIAFISSTPCVGFISSPGGAILFRSFSYSNSFPASAGTEFSTSNNYHSLTASWGLIEPLVAPSLLSPLLSVFFQWSAVSGATNYWLQVNTSADFTGTDIYNDVVGNVLQIEVSGFTPGTTYYWRVKAGNIYGWGAWSVVLSFIASIVT